MITPKTTSARTRMVRIKSPDFIRSFYYDHLFLQLSHTVFKMLSPLLEAVYMSQLAQAGESRTVSRV
jgi:hypothetical protein